MGKFTHLMIHATDTPASFDVTPEHIRKWHIEENGWSRVGYSMLIERSAKLDMLIPFDRDDVIESWEISNGARGWNGRTKHLCWAGGASNIDNRTDSQKAVLAAIAEFIVMFYPDVKLIGHNQVSEKDCPSFYVPTWAESIGISPKNIDYKQYI